MNPSSWLDTCNIDIGDEYYVSFDFYQQDGGIFMLWWISSRCNTTTLIEGRRL